MIKKSIILSVVIWASAFWVQASPASHFGTQTVGDAKAAILKKAKQQLKKRYADGYRFSIRPRWIPNKVLQRDPHQILAVELEGGVSRYTNFDVSFSSRGERKQAQIQLAVEVERKLPVVVQRLRRGNKISKIDLEYRWISMLQNQKKLVADIKSLVGKTLKRTLLSGQPIPKSYISRDYVIEAGDQVRIIIQRKGIEVQVAGEARESGAKGDRIKIYSSETRRKYEGEVVRPGITLWKNTL